MRRATAAVLLLNVVVAIMSCGGTKSPRKTINANAFRDSLEVSLSTSLEANRLTQSPSGELVFDLDDATEALIVAKLQRSISAGESVDDKLLTWLRDDFSEEFKSHFMEGNRLYLDGLVNGDVAAQAAGNELIMQWAEYWKNNRDEITDKMYPAP